LPLFLPCPEKVDTWRTRINCETFMFLEVLLIVPQAVAKRYGETDAHNNRLTL